MSKIEINECVELNNELIKKMKKKAKQLSDIAETLEQIAPMVCITEIHREITHCMEEIEMAKNRNAKRKKQLKLLEQLEALENE